MPSAGEPQRAVLRLYASTLFLSAALLFLVQPMFAKMALPLFGGVPAVWNACAVFFQAALLAGYAYAHALARTLDVRRQMLAHAVVMLVALVALPVALPDGWTPAATGAPLGELLWLLTVAVGLPFFVVASTAPLLQHWFGTGRQGASRDPYHLYAASNAGSMAALLSYPVLIEPALSRHQLSVAWSLGYLLLAGFIGACAAARWKAAPGSAPSTTPGDGATGRAVRLGAGAATAPHTDRAVPAAHAPTWRTRLHWVALSAAPSSLLLGVTTHVTTDVAVVPLLWVIPLSLYLLTFVLVFARRQTVPTRWMLRLLPIAAVAMLVMLVTQATEPAWLVILLHLLVFFVAAMACHGQLARTRPDVGNLTQYYLLIGLGGVLGGMFNVLAAPMLFASTVEYPLALVLACMLVPSHRRQEVPGPVPEARAGRATIAAAVALRSARRRGTALDIAYPALVGAASVAVVLYTNQTAFSDDRMRLALSAGLPALACYLASERPLRFGLTLAAVFLAGQFDTATRGSVVESSRSFFGLHRVTAVQVSRDDASLLRFHLLFHGTTVHGAQYRDDDGHPVRANEPLTYYGRTGPIGQVFAASRVREARARRVGVVGLGAGALLAYAEPGDQFTVFEIDPTVLRIATDERLFSFYREARQRGAQVAVTLGDARLQLATVPDRSFDLLILDAFSSDAIPMHLLTTEALAIYLAKLDGGGLLAFHVSNRYLRLHEAMAALSATLGVAAAVRHDRVSAEERSAYRYSSDWVVMARDASELAPLVTAPPASRWQTLRPPPGTPPWTDDFSSIVGVFEWSW